MTGAANTTALLRSAAGELDRLEDEIKALNGQKSDIYGSVREAVGTIDYKSWRRAVKLRRKRAVNPQEFDEAEDAVTNMLRLLGAIGSPGEERPMAASSGPGRGVLSEATRAREAAA